MRVSVITVSDRAFRGEYEDESGEEIRRAVLETYPDAEVSGDLVPDEEQRIRAALEKNLTADFILTTGGTGISERDITPEITEQFCDKELPGISEIIRAESFKETPHAMLSRGYAGLRDKTVIVNFPGSVKAVRTCMRIVLPIMEHAISMVKGQGH